MAAEMSCLRGIDEDGKDADTEVNALTLLQNPVRMMQESSSCTISFNKPSPKPNCVLDAMSNADMLSPVGLGNGPPSRQATEALDINSISIEKEEEKNITPLKTVQEIDTAGIWEFDVESPENSLDNLNGAEDLSWDPHREFMQFLWENNSSGQGEESKDEVKPVHGFKKRKRKMDMVVMADPSADLYHDLSPRSSDDLSDPDFQLDSSSARNALKSRKLSKSQSSYPNGTAKAMKEILYTTSTRNSHENHNNHGLSSLKRKLAMNSETEKKTAYYSCSKCDLEFKKALHLNRHMKCHAEPSKMSHDSFVCRECGESFQQSNALIEHMSTHREQNPRLKGEIVSTKDEKEMEKNAIFYCPQCSFGADSPNSFVQHAKTHEKDKKKYSCDKCSFQSLSEKDLRRHDIMQHTVITDIKQIPYDRSDSFSCNICTYKTYNKNVFTNHLQRRHHQTFKDYNCDLLGDKNAQPRGKGSEDGKFTSKILINNQIASKTTCLPNETSGISDLFKNSKMKRGPKSQLTESKLDKSINVLLSRQRLGKKAAELMERNNSKLSDLHSKADEDGCNELPDITPVKTKDSLNHRSPNGPRFNAEPSGNKKSSSKRKMSTPYHNTSDQESSFNFLKPLQSSKMVDQEEEDELENDIFQFDDTDSNSTPFDNNIRKEKQNIIYTYSRRMPMREALQASKRLFGKMKSAEQTDNDSEIKEECIETEVFKDTFEPHQIPLGESFSDDFSEFDSEHNCPYCPAIFESGVGLSNHVRGHLYRVGLTYNARHVVPPEQVACRDRRPRIRRKISALRQLKKALQQESDSETARTTVHSCPLCGDSFDNRTGQSNHIRGHLKKIGRNFASKSKPPLVLLRELMRDKREFQRALQIIGKRHNHYHYGASPKRQAVNRLAPPSTDILQSGLFPSLRTDAKPPMPSFSVGEQESGELETKSDIRDSLAGTTALIGILKKRKCQEDARLKAAPPIARNSHSLVPLNTEDSASRVASSLPNSISEKGEFNRKVCIHCNATFHSGISLSNHLRAYAKRQRIALRKGTTTIDCKAVRTRSRPGSKKKTPPINQTPEEIYRLTCRFCDLVFQGPLSVQEDWVKHLQRHIMNTGVPHTGLGMVEVTSLSKNPPTLKTEEEEDDEEEEEEDDDDEEEEDDDSSPTAAS